MFSADFISRFNAKWIADLDSDCRIWIGAHLPKGYGIMKLPKQRKQGYAHRLSWIIHRGEIPEGMKVLHGCDNPACVNPDHLFLGTTQTNTNDMVAKDRHTRGERSGTAKLTEADVWAIRAYLAAGMAQVKVAEIFKVSQMQISRINAGQRWAHLKVLE